MSRERLDEHRRVWRAKAVLRRVYRPWFDGILREIPAHSRVLEVGAGPGFLAEFARRARPDLRWVASDLLAAPWNTLAADALQLPARPASFEAVVGLDFIHHLARPADFFRETARVLKPGGLLLAVEPWITPLSYPVYRFLHHERCSGALDPWAPFADVSVKDAFDGDSALVSALVRRTTPERWRELGLEPPRVDVLNGFTYLLSLGFKPGCLLPAAAAGTFLRLDERTRGLASWTGLRARLAWRTALPPSAPST